MISPTKVELGEVGQSAVVHGLRLYAAQLRSEIAEQRAKGMRCASTEILLELIEGQEKPTIHADGREQPAIRGLLWRLGEPKVDLTPRWRPVEVVIAQRPVRSENVADEESGDWKPGHSQLCETTSTHRLPRSVCTCLTMIDDLGPCETFKEGQSGNCVFCEHTLHCHMAATECERQPLPADR